MRVTRDAIVANSVALERMPHSLNCDTVLPQHLEMWSRAGPALHQHLLDRAIVPSAPVLALLGNVGTPAGRSGMQAYTSYIYHMAAQVGSDSQLVLLSRHHFLSNFSSKRFLTSPFPHFFIHGSLSLC